MTDTTQSLSYWQVISRSILGALTAHFLFFLVFWLISFGPTPIEVLEVALIQIVTPLLLGAFAGLLWNLYRPEAPRIGPFMMAIVIMLLSAPMAFLIYEWLSIPPSSNYVVRSLVFASVMTLAGLAIALLLFGVLTIAGHLAKRAG